MTLRFTSYEVHPVKEFGNNCQTCDDNPEEADFWSVYGRLPSLLGGADVLICIGDFNTKEAAELVHEFVSDQSTL